MKEFNAILDAYLDLIAKGASEAEKKAFLAGLKDLERLALGIVLASMGL